jgi:hypothetical protein
VNEPVPSAKQLEDVAFKFAVALVVCLACAIVDGFDGATWMKGRTFRLTDDPAGFWGVLVVRWGYAAILMAIGAIATGLGALVLKGPGKASKDQ